MKKEDEKIIYGRYCRKSEEDEGKQVNSIKDQERELEEIEVKEKINVAIKFSGESQTAHDPGRPIFANLIKSIETGKINALLVWNANRLSRNPLDAGMIIYLMDIEKLKEIKTPSRTYHNNANDKFLLNLDFSISKKDSDEKSVAVKRALKGRALRGLPSGVSKVGFLNDKTEEKGNRKWIVDEERFPLVQQLFEEMIKGKSSPAQIYRYAKDELGLTTVSRKKVGGKPIAFSYIYFLLRDPIYAGFFFYNGQRCELDKRLPRVITEEEYWKIQAMLGAKGKPRPTKHAGLYNAFLRCGTCNGIMSSDFKFQLLCPNCKYKFSSINKDHCPKCEIKIEEMINPTHCSYIYYYCISNKKHRTVCPASTIEEKKVNKTIYDKFTNEICISKDLSDWCLKYLSVMKDQEIQNESEVKVALEEQETKVKKKLNKLLSYRITIPDITQEQEEIFDAQEKELQQEWFDIKQRKNHTIDWYSEAIKEFNLMTKIEEILEKGTPAEKRELFHELRSNLTISEKNLSISNRKSIDTFAKYILRARSENRAFEPKNFFLAQIEKLKYKSLFRTLNNALEVHRKISKNPISKGSFFRIPSNLSLKLSEIRDKSQTSKKSSVSAKPRAFDSTFSILLRG